jgi:hypothetical protein
MFENTLHILNWSKFIPKMENLLMMGNGKIWTVDRIKFMNNAQLEENLGNNIQLTYVLPGGGWELYEINEPNQTKIKPEMNDEERKKILKETLESCSIQEINRKFAEDRMWLLKWERERAKDYDYMYELWNMVEEYLIRKMENRNRIKKFDLETGRIFIESKLYNERA